MPSLVIFVLRLCPNGNLKKASREPIAGTWIVPWVFNGLIISNNSDTEERFYRGCWKSWYLTVEYQYIVRIVGNDIPGERNMIVGLTQIRGIV